MSVAITPGVMALTRIPSLATSRDTPITMESTPALAAAYHTHSLAPPNGAAIDDNITTEPPLPPCLVDMRLTQARRHSSAPKGSRPRTSRMGAELSSCDRGV